MLYVFDIAFDHVTRVMFTHSAYEAVEVEEPSRRTVTVKKYKSNKLLEGHVLRVQ